MSNNHTGNIQPSIDLEEHRSKNVSAKATVDHGYLPGTDQYVPITAVDNGDGTYSMKTTASLTGGGGDGAILDGVSPTIKANVLDLASSNPLATAIVDGSGNQITSFGGGTQYADGAARGTATGTLALGDDGTNLQSIKVDSNGVQAIQDNGGSITVDATSLPLPTGAATSAAQTDKSQFTKLTDGTDTALITASGEQNVIATAQPGVDIGDVTINNAAGASAVNIQDGGNSITVDGSVSVSNMIAAVETGLAKDTSIGSLTETAPATDTASSGLNGRLQRIAQRLSSLIALLPAALGAGGGLKVDGSGTPLPISGTVTANTGLTQPLTDTQLRATPVPVSGSVTATVASTTITGTVTTKETRAATPAQTSPSVTAASTSILASNANRLGATIYNEGTATCYLKLGATASLTSYSIQIASGGYYEVPFGYTGAIDGITSASTAQLRVTEVSA